MPFSLTHLVDGSEHLSLSRGEAVRQGASVPADVALHLEAHVVAEPQRARRLQGEVPDNKTMVLNFIGSGMVQTIQ